MPGCRTFASASCWMTGTLVSAARSARGCPTPWTRSPGPAPPWADYFADIDVFVCPSNFTTAITHDSRPFDERRITTPDGERSYSEQPFWISHASLPGLPAVVAPAGLTPAGLPVGVQVIGPLFEDDTAITFAELLAEVTGGYQAPDLASSAP